MVSWINDDNIDLKKSLININKDLEKIDRGLYNSYRNKLEVDNINLLYVVLTRAAKELHIISEKNLDSRGNENINYFSGIFISYLKNKGINIKTTKFDARIQNMYGNYTLSTKRPSVGQFISGKKDRIT